jgi:hypothetical protein
MLSTKLAFGINLMSINVVRYHRVKDIFQVHGTDN